MERMEAARAFKSSFFPELAMKSTNPQGFPDDFWCINGGDDFSIDEFFDLPNEENFEDDEEKKASSSLSLSSSQEHLDDSNSNSLNFTPDLAIPVDDVQELELWSHLMDDSIPEHALAYPSSISDTQNKKTRFSAPVEPGRKLGVTRVLLIPSAVPHKPRSKRPRTAGTRFTFLGSPPKTESSSSSTPPSPVSTLLFSPPVEFSKPPLKKQKKKPACESTVPAVQRRCSHCQVTKTPQWRAGPAGPKTLCNACGVRFKSGRLFPEYRPACSPTFSSEIHSNSHRKVLEMRRKKDTEIAQSPTGSASTVCSS